jgi:CubicO group peptidase (beta-lactamase class C family)
MSVQGRNDSSASGGLPASSLQRRLSGDESEGSAVATRPNAGIAALAQAQPGVKPGQDFHYSNVDYMLVGMIPEARSGKRFAALFNELIVPLVGPGVSLGLPPTTGLARQRGYVGTLGAVQVFEGNPPELQVWQDALSQTSGGVFATVTGYAKWQQSHQQASDGELTQLPAGYLQRLRASVDGYACDWEVGALPDAFKEKVCLFH